MSIVNPPLFDTPIYNPSNYNSQTSSSGIKVNQPATPNGITYYSSGNLNTDSTIVISSTNLGVGTATPSAKVDVIGPSSGNIINVKKSFDTSDSSTSQSLPPIDMTSATVTVLDSSFTASASTNSATSYYVFDSNDANAWIGTDSGYTLQAGSTYQYTGSASVTSADTGLFYGEYVQIYSPIGFKVNTYRFKTANNANRYDPKIMALFGSNDGINFIRLDQLSIATLGANTFSSTYSPSSINFYKYYRFASYQVYKYGTGNFFTLNQLELKGVPATSPLLFVNDSNCLINPTVGNCLIGSTSLTSTNAVLELKSTSKGFLPPRLTSSQITALQSASTASDNGMVVYDSTNNALKLYNGSSFVSVGSTTTPYYFKTGAVGNTAVNVTPTNVVWSTTLNFNTSNWTSPIVTSVISGTSLTDRISFPTTGLYFIGGCISVNAIPNTKACNLGIYEYTSLTSSTTASNQNLISICGSTSDRPRPNFSYLLNVTSTSSTYSIFVYQDSGANPSILSESYIFSFRVA